MVALAPVTRIATVLFWWRNGAGEVPLSLIAPCSTAMVELGGSARFLQIWR
jgi:hypothetical protein